MRKEHHAHALKLMHIKSRAQRRRCAPRQRAPRPQPSARVDATATIHTYRFAPCSPRASARAGGYARDGPGGTHHITIPSPLEADPGTGPRYAIAHLRFDGGLALRADALRALQIRISQISEHLGHDRHLR